MAHVLHFPNRTPQANCADVAYRGLVSLLRYDPHLPRCFNGLKENLLRGRPSVMRLHAGANYPTVGEAKLRVDEEGQAVVVVGYDDDLQAFAVIDPYPRSEPDRTSLQWIGYDELEVTMVDSSKGSESPWGGLEWKVVMSETGSVVKIAVGLPQISGIIMDHDALVLTDVGAAVTLVSTDVRKTSTVSIPGTFLVNEWAEFEIDVPEEAEDWLEVTVSVDAKLRGCRPYEYSDPVGIDVRQRLEIGRKQDVRTARYA